jgi:PPOX class probable F420-dependent enzyme
MDESLARVAGARVGSLGTIRPDRTPHLVPMVFALTDGSVVTAIDWKPKGAGRLQRLANIDANPTVSFLVHHYSEDWSELWWVRVDGIATIHLSGPVWEEAVAALQAKYDQYRERPPQGEVISIAPTRVSSWSSKQ